MINLSIKIFFTNTSPSILEKNSEMKEEKYLTHHHSSIGKNTKTKEKEYLTQDLENP